MPGAAERLHTDLEAEQREYETERRKLEELMPRARRLCLKYELRDPFPGLLRISLGRHAPQHRLESAIGRNERTAATDCLVRMSEECRLWKAEGGAPEPERTPRKQSLLERLIDLFS